MCGLIGKVTICTVFVGRVWCVDCLVWQRSVQLVYECLMCGLLVCLQSVHFVWEVSGLWTEWYGYVLYSLSGICLVCGLNGIATFCTVRVRVSGVWNVWCGYGLYSLCGECLVCTLFGVATFCTFCV